jgi:hypothetical protein
MHPVWWGLWKARRRENGGCVPFGEGFGKLTGERTEDAPPDGLGGANEGRREDPDLNLGIRRLHHNMKSVWIGFIGILKIDLFHLNFWEILK